MKEFHRHNNEQKRPDAAACVLYDSIYVTVRNQSQARRLFRTTATFKINPVPPTPGGDLHYHLSQHGVFSEKEMRFYATEIILGLEHMHHRSVVYRDLKVSCAGGVWSRRADISRRFPHSAPASV